MIVITGAGIVSALGRGKAETLRALQEQRSGIAPIDILGTVHRALPAGEVRQTNAALCRELGIADETGTARTTLLGITAVSEALADCGEISGENAVLLSGTTVGGMDITEREYPDGDPVFLRHHYAGSTTRAIADHFGNTFSRAATISTACSAAANAIITGARMLEDGAADVVVAGGSEALSRYHLNGFRSLMILSDEPCRPFDAARRGLNLGEGAAFLVLETEEHALKRGATIMATLSGWGNRCDAFHQTATSDDGEGPYLAMTAALQKAGLQPADISYINAHGTATENNDRSELAALHRVFGRRLPPFSSTKAFTGHTTSTSGSIEAVISLLALQHNFLPANLNFAHSIDGEPAPVTTQQPTEKLRHILSNAFAFGGNDSALVISRYEGADARPSNHPGTKVKPTGEIWRLTDENTDEMAQNENKTVANGAPTAQNGMAKRAPISPMKLRRMDGLLREIVTRSTALLDKAGLERPDAIIVNTAFGMMTNTQRFLDEMLAQHEEALSPTAFMQSTHNTMAAQLAILTGCHGYNITYSDLNSADFIENDALSLLRNGDDRSVLVVSADRLTDRWRQLLQRNGLGELIDAEGVSVRLLGTSRDK